MITFTQCAAVIIHWWVSRAAPHLCRNCPFLYCRKLTCQGHSPYWAIPPPTIRCPRCRINLRPQTSLYAAFGLRVSKLRWRSDLWPEVIMPNELLSISLQNVSLNNLIDDRNLRWIFIFYFCQFTYIKFWKIYLFEAGLNWQTNLLSNSQLNAFHFPFVLICKQRWSLSAA